MYHKRTTRMLYKQLRMQGAKPAQKQLCVGDSIWLIASGKFSEYYSVTYPQDHTSNLQLLQHWSGYVIFKRVRNYITM